MMMAELDKVLAQSKVAKVDAEISIRARRISSGASKPTDFGELNVLVGKRASLLLPKSVQLRLQGQRDRRVIAKG